MIDYLRYIESKAIKDYLRKNPNKFTMENIVKIISDNYSVSLLEKFEDYQSLIDYGFIDEKFSLLLKQKMNYEKELIFKAYRGKGLYRYSNSLNNPNMFDNYDDCLKALIKNEEREYKESITYQEGNDIDKTITIFLNIDHMPSRIVSNGFDKPIDALRIIDNSYINLKEAFREGDIVREIGNEKPIILLNNQCYEPNNRNYYLNGYYYIDGLMYTDKFNPLELIEYSLKETMEYKTLKMISDLVNKKMDIASFVMGYPLALDNLKIDLNYYTQFVD